jgi:hypothetical protein
MRQGAVSGCWLLHACFRVIPENKMPEKSGSILGLVFPGNMRQFKRLNLNGCYIFNEKK